MKERSADFHTSHVAAGRMETRDARNGEMTPDLRATRILSVEDRAENQTIISSILTSAGYHVDCAANGNEAVSLCGANRYEMILMDIHMPGMGGFEATQIIRHSDHPNRATSIIAMTGQPMSGAVAEVASAGFNDCITKPFRKAELLGKVAFWVVAGQGTAARPVLGEHMAPPFFFQDDLDEFVDLMGPETVLRWIDNLQETLLPKLTYLDGDVTSLRALAHDIVAKAGLLGFRGLADSCTRLEQKLLCDLGLQELASTRKDARRVSDALTQLRLMLQSRAHSEC